MLLQKEFVNRPAPQEVWLESIEEAQPAPVDPAATTKILRSRVRKLRRMQSQNFVQRALYDLTGLLGAHAESA